MTTFITPDLFKKYEESIHSAEYPMEALEHCYEEIASIDKWRALLTEASTNTISRIYSVAWQTFFDLGASLSPEKLDTLLKLLHTLSIVPISTKMLSISVVSESRANSALLVAISRITPQTPPEHAMNTLVLMIGLFHNDFELAGSFTQEEFLQFCTWCIDIFSQHALLLSTEDQNEVVQFFRRAEAFACREKNPNYPSFLKFKFLIWEILLPSWFSSISQLLSDKTSNIPIVARPYAIYDLFLTDTDSFFPDINALSFIPTSTWIHIYQAFVKGSPSLEGLLNARFLSVVDRCYERLDCIMAYFGTPVFTQTLTLRTPEKMRPQIIRTIEMHLIGSDRCVSMLERTLTLLSLELMCIGIHRLCLEEGITWKAHPTESCFTLGTTNPSSFQLQMEEGAAMGNLDVACARFCKNNDWPESRAWVIFSVRTYLQKLLLAQKKYCFKTDKEMLREIDFGTVGTASSSVLHMNDHADIRAYEAMCSNSLTLSTEEAKLRHPDLR